MSKKRGSLLLVSLLFLTSACSTFHLKVGKALNDSQDGGYAIAAESLKADAFSPGKDQLAYLLDYALLQLLAGNHEESNKAFHLADEISEVKDYVSLGDQSASLVFGEGMMTYKGDDYEKLLINSFSAINYAALGKPESSLVEIRRLNDKLNKYAVDAGREYSANPFVYYLAANLWEMESKWDDALIDYEKFYQLRPGSKIIEQDLLYASYKARNFKKLEIYKKQFSVKKYGKKEATRREEKPELLVIYLQGKGPIKQANPVWIRLPKLYPRTSYIDQVSVRAPGGEEVKTETAVALSQLVIDALDKQYAGLIAKRIAARVVKHQIAQRIEKQDEGLGLLARVVMEVSDQADLRQWMGLPNSIQIAKLHLPEGPQELKLSYLSSESLVSEKNINIEIKKNQKNFLIVRSYR